MKNIFLDPTLDGGGLHQIFNGGSLNIHTDYNSHYKEKKWKRVLNLLIYLNKDWKDEYNGNLELWNTDLTKAEVKVKPDFNRMVCFNTQPEGDIIAYHGHPTPLNVPEGVYRKSIALYYYTKEKPNHTFADKHKTLYKDTK